MDVLKVLGHKLKVNLVFWGCCEVFASPLSAHLVPDGVCGCDPNSVLKLVIKELTSAVGMAHSCKMKVFIISLSSCFQREPCRRMCVLGSDDKLVLQ